MGSQPSVDDEGEGAKPAGEAGQLDAKLDRAVPGSDAVAFLVAVAGDKPGRVYPLNRNTVIVGRLEGADIYISEPSVSGRHARIINGSHGFEIEDLDSTNGTFVGGQRITKSRLRNGDRLMLGTVEFSFLLDRPVEATVALLPAGRWMPTSTPGALMRLPEPRPLPAPPLPQQAPVEEAEPTFTDVVHRLVLAYRFLVKHSRIIFAMASVGAVLGMGSILLLPPPPAAMCEVKLQPALKSNPVAEGERPADDAPQFFGGPQRAFTNPELVRVTLRQFDGADPDEGRIESVAGRLKFENLEDPHLYRASYKESLLAGRRLPTVEFLTAHLHNYVQAEITKALKVFTAEAEFLRNQLATVEKQLSVISAERTEFRQANADRLPEEALQTHTSRFQLESRRADLLAQVRRLQGDLDAERMQLNSEAPLAQTKMASSQVYRQNLANVNQKLSEAYARGLADGHPEVRQLKDEKQRIEGLIESEMHADTTSVDRVSNAGLQAVRNRVEMLQGQLSAARSDLADTERSLGQVRTVVGDLPRVEERVQELNHRQEATSHLHTQLFEKLKKAELQLNLERVSAEQRYEMVTPPRMAKMGKAKVAGIRLGIGLVVGLFLAAVAIAIREGRQIVKDSLATLESRDRPTSSWR